MLCPFNINGIVAFLVFLGQNHGNLVEIYQSNLDKIWSFYSDVISLKNMEFNRKKDQLTS